MEKKLQDKIKLFRIIHGTHYVYVSTSGQLFLKLPKDFTGRFLEWYKSGQLESEFNYKNGERHGKFLWYYKNGQLCSSCNYKNGKRIG